MCEAINLVENFKVEKVIFNCGEFNELEQDLIEKYNLKDIDVLKVGHHGSKTSSSKTFIDEINPKYSIISAGKNNRYGHPNDSVIDNLEDSKNKLISKEKSTVVDFVKNPIIIKNSSTMKLYLRRFYKY